MPIKRASAKSVRQDKKRHLRNTTVKKELKEIEHQLKKPAVTKDPAKYKELTLKLISKLDKAASKGIIHGNRASRKKSRLLKRLNRLGNTAKEEKVKSPAEDA